LTGVLGSGQRGACALSGIIGVTVEPFNDGGAIEEHLRADCTTLTHGTVSLSMKASA
jgi:hypothetical protein